VHPDFDFPPIETARLRLRPLREADVPAFFALFAEPVVARYLSAPPMTDPAQAAEKVASIMRHYAAGDLLQLGIELRESGALIGTCTLHQIHRQNRRAELGYVLGSAWWGEGLMHEALVAFVGHAFGHFQFHRLEADIDPRNEKSAKSLQRLGFQHEGLLRERWIVAGEVSDSALYGLLASDWQARQH
jgi:RimJ/RimL family protein N-acetyltransferase